ncbi:hypothetical protein CN277_11145 [Bacillus cereus]|uniref:hypothetical protein n=1 Tax=Bacillus cereus TaxID=1396 RepID=UPI000BED41D9|nr:hypothetical protein [Bacillus cereus]PEE56851.1 hypothetical protein COM68_22210 [Bacillus cereus]PFC62514.1 hypothetical protein CN267_08615 [Bacillus cereus]PFD02798.1 hypothetical protein CN277_11145 [Bacillus cereus]
MNNYNWDSLSVCCCRKITSGGKWIAVEPNLELYNFYDIPKVGQHLRVYICNQCFEKIDRSSIIENVKRANKHIFKKLLNLMLKRKLKKLSTNWENYSSEKKLEAFIQIRNHCYSELDLKGRINLDEIRIGDRKSMDISFGKTRRQGKNILILIHEDITLEKSIETIAHESFHVKQLVECDLQLNAFQEYAPTFNPTELIKRKKNNFVDPLHWYWKNEFAAYKSVAQIPKNKRTSEEGVRTQIRYEHQFVEITARQYGCYKKELLFGK